MAPIRTLSFVAEFPLQTSAADEAELATRFDAARHIYNACRGEALRRLDLMRDSTDWQRARAMPLSVKADGKRAPNRGRSQLFQKTQARFGFAYASIQKFAEQCRDSCWIGDHLGSHDTQTTSLRAFRAVQKYMFRIAGRPRFKGFRRINSVEGKSDTVIRYRGDPAPCVHWAGLTMPLMLDPTDNKAWQTEALSARTKYVRIIRRSINGRTRWLCQLIQEGMPPATHGTKTGVVGLDIGPSTIAAVSSADAVLERFCPEVVEPWMETRRIQRTMDRSRRATNPDNYDDHGRCVRGRGKWNRSNRYRKTAARKNEIDRRLAAGRKRAHGELANRILAQGTTIKTEKLSYLSFQKNFGRSVKVRAPGMFIETLRRKAADAGGGMIDINTRKTRLSQFDHTTGEYIKKPLSQRIHVFGDGVTKPVQRDLYSAFLATCCDSNSLDYSQVKEAWPGAEPLLRRVGIEDYQSASGKGFARPHVRKVVRADRPSKRDGRPHEAGDAVAQARAPESVDNGSLRTPWL